MHLFQFDICNIETAFTNTDIHLMLNSKHTFWRFFHIKTCLLLFNRLDDAERTSPEKAVLVRTHAETASLEAGLHGGYRMPPLHLNTWRDHWESLNSWLHFKICQNLIILLEVLRSLSVPRVSALAPRRAPAASLRGTSRRRLRRI